MNIYWIIIFGSLVTISLAIGLILLADIFLAHKGGFPATISYKMMLYSIEYPIIPALLCTILAYSFGLLSGHFWWSQTLNVTVPCPVSQ